MTLSQDEYDGIDLVEMDVDTARALIDNVDENFGTSLDEAQAPVFKGDSKRSYILIVISK